MNENDLNNCNRRQPSPRLARDKVRLDKPLRGVPASVTTPRSGGWFKGGCNFSKLGGVHWKTDKPAESTTIRTAGKDCKDRRKWLPAKELRRPVKHCSSRLPRFVAAPIAVLARKELQPAGLTLASRPHRSATR